MVEFPLVAHRRLLKSHKLYLCRAKWLNIDVHDKLIYVDAFLSSTIKVPLAPFGWLSLITGKGAEEPYQGEPVPTGANCSNFKTLYIICRWQKGADSVVADAIAALLAR